MVYKREKEEGVGPIYYGIKQAVHSLADLYGSINVEVVIGRRKGEHIVSQVI